MDVLSSPKSFDEVTDATAVVSAVGAVTLEDDDDDDDEDDEDYSGWTTEFHHRGGVRPPPQSRDLGHPGHVEADQDDDDDDDDDDAEEDDLDDEREEQPSAPPSLPQAAVSGVGSGTASRTAPTSLPAPTYPVSGANGSHPRVAAMARYDSFGMDDEDDDDEEEEHRGGHGHFSGRRRRRSSHLGCDDYDDDEEEEEGVCDESDDDYHHRDDEEGEFEFDCSHPSSFAPPSAPSRTRSFRPFQTASGAANNAPPSAIAPAGPTVSFPSLPQDALHAIASFSTPGDFSRLSSSCRASHRACRDVFRRAWRHAFRCAQEVYLAWAKGEHGDARELAALYLERGVPLYPLPEGTGRRRDGGAGGEDPAYGTVEWRMGLEIRETMVVATASGEVRRVENEESHAYMNGPGGRGGATARGERGGEETGDAADEDDDKTKLDPFYRHRFETPSSSSSSPSFRERRSFEHRARDRDHRIRRFDYHDFLAERLGVDRFQDLPRWHPPPGRRDRRDRFSLAMETYYSQSLHSPPPLPLTYVEEKALFWKRQKGIPVGADASPPAALAHVPNDVEHRGHPHRSRPLNHHWNRGRDAPPFDAVRGSRRHSLSHPPQFPFRHAWRDRPREGNDDDDEEDERDNNHWGGRPSNNHYDDHGNRNDDDLDEEEEEDVRVEDPPEWVSRRNSLGSTRGSDARRVASGVPTSARPRHRPTAPAAEPPKMTLPIHRHLADQHLFGLPSAHDSFGDRGSRRRRAVADGISLDVDFFHPQWNGAVARTRRAHRQSGGAPSFVDEGEDSDLEREYQFERRRDHEEAQERDRRHLDADIRRILHDAMAIRAGDATETETAEGVDVTARAPRPCRRSAGRRHSVQMTPSVETASPHPFGDTDAAARPSSPWNATPASDVRLEIYSLANPAASSDTSPSSPAARAVLRARVRCAHRQRLAESHLADYDLPALRECLLDLWDDMLPATAGIHYHNGQAPVPRASSLREFVTRPCPKALGTVQCEIVRVKTSKSKKGVDVKGRFFPTYEYRLFIRDPVGDGNGNGNAATMPRRDAVLLVATTKSGGRRNRRKRRSSHLAVSGSSPSAASVGGEGEERTSDYSSGPSSGNKRGVTNYYLCLPQQRDVDVHYRSSNAGSIHYLPPGEKSGLTVSPLAETSKAPVEVGRLQSNFIGTEFQIFSPTAAKPSPPQSATSTAIASSRGRPSSSDEETEGRSGEGDAVHRPHGSNGNRSAPFRRASMDAVIPPAVHSKARRRGSGLVRLARRASLTVTRRGSMTNHNKSPQSHEHRDGHHDDDDDPAVNVRDPPPPEETRPSRAIRRMSWGPSFATGVKKATRNRRAIANAAGEESGGSTNPGGVVDEECGAITYTANLLGNRPRIMDVCIPVVGEDGRPSSEWRGGGEGGTVAAGDSGGDHSHGGNMLHRFKSIQSRWETPEGTDNPADADAAPAAAPEHTPHPDERGLTILQNRPPWWNMELGAFVLNFGGRVSVASVKNFQLCERGNVDAPTLVQFGRIQGRHSFTMDFQYPMTPVQAFAIAISSLQSKISFG